jgi:hypothetical protein
MKLIREQASACSSSELLPISGTDPAEDGSDHQGLSWSEDPGAVPVATATARCSASGAPAVPWRRDPHPYRAMSSTGPAATR